MMNAPRPDPQARELASEITVWIQAHSNPVTRLRGDKKTTAMVMVRASTHHFLTNGSGVILHQ